MKKTIAVKNLRVFGQRIPDTVFRAVAEQLLPGPDPATSELKNGAKSKAQTLAALCRTDGVWRARVKAAASAAMSQAALEAAKAAGWIDTAADELAVWEEVVRVEGPTSTLHGWAALHV